jgi:hypothetical protein
MYPSYPIYPLSLSGNIAGVDTWDRGDMSFRSLSQNYPIHNYVPFLDKSRCLMLILYTTKA